MQGDASQMGTEPRELVLNPAAQTQSISVHRVANNCNQYGFNNVRYRIGGN